MIISDIRIRQIDQDNNRMKAVVSVTFDNVFVVHDIKVIQGKENLFVAMPSRKSPDGDFKDVAHPINQEMRDIVNNAILNKYETLIYADTEKCVF